MKLKISDDLPLPLNVVTEKLAFLGRTGSGKTYAAQKLAELMHEAGAQFVALDPVGKWYSLRLAADGKSPGIPLPVFGGLQGDVPLEAAGGNLIADLIIDRGLSAVVDVSQFESDSDKARFMTDFGARFFFRKKSEPSAVHLFIEEAQEFLPQNPQKNETHMLHVWTRIQKLGRNFGIGSSLLSQRPQEVNKKVLNQTELLFVFQITGPQEREAIANWIEEKGIDEDIAADLPKLTQGSPHVWSPAWLNISKVVTILPKWTYDASSTPKVGARKTVMKELSPIDIEDLKSKMSATIERLKADDPKELRRQIIDLQKQLKARPVPAKAETKTIEKFALKDGQLARAEGLIEKLNVVHAKASDHLRDMAKMVDEIGGAIRMTKSKDVNDIFASRIPARKPSRNITGNITNPPRAMLERSSGNGDTLPIGERKILTALVQFPNPLQRNQLTVLTGYKRSSRDAYIQRLQGRGYAEIVGDCIQPTADGATALGEIEPLPTGDALRDYWINKLPQGERAIFEQLISVYPDAIDRDVLSESTGYQRSSRDAYLQRMNSKQLIEIVGRGQVKASDQLFG